MQVAFPNMGLSGYVGRSVLLNAKLKDNIRVLKSLLLEELLLKL